MKKSRVKLPS